MYTARKCCITSIYIYIQTIAVRRKVKSIGESVENSTITEAFVFCLVQEDRSRKPMQYLKKAGRILLVLASIMKEHKKGFNLSVTPEHVGSVTLA